MDDRTCKQCGGMASVATPQRLCPACSALAGLQSNTQVRQQRRRNDWQPPTVETIAERFPDLDGIQLVGRGGMGAVYRARQKHLDRIVALKILPPQLLEDRTFGERFTREAKAMARLNHPNIVTIHDFGQRDDLFFFIMEYVDGLTLRQVQARGRISPQQAVAIVPQICDALQYAHEQGIVHRDVKPENVLLNRRGEVKIADFGLAKLIGAAVEDKPAMDATTSVVGTPLYMAPEQIAAPQAVDHRADIYSLGVILYELLTGELPDGDFRPLTSRMQVDVKLNELVMRALEPDPAMRFRSAVEFRTQLGTLAMEAAAIALPSPRSNFGQKVASGSTDAPDVEKVRASLRIPAKGIKYVAIVNIVFLFVTTIPALISYVASAPDKVIDHPLGLHLSLPWWATGTFIFTVASIGLNAFIVAGARHMREVGRYRMALAAAILCLFAAPGNVVGAVFGGWAIWVLARKRTRQAFAEDAHRQGA